MKSGDILFFYGESDKGLVRRENQDSYIFSEITSSFFLAAVFDGMGGLSSGLVASTLAKETLTEYLTDALKNHDAKKTSDTRIKDILSDAVAYTSLIVNMRSLKLPEGESMGTTLAAILLTPKKAYIFSVGDSRVYALISRKLHLLTTDHTFVRYLVDTKQISDDEAENHPLAHVLTKAIGTEDFVLPDITVLNLSKVNSFLICSDGLTLHVSDNEIASVMKEIISPEEKVKQLMALTKERGANDNITILTVSPNGEKTLLRKEHS